jgi:Flp pilus assembly pilin Flp
MVSMINTALLHAYTAVSSFKARITEERGQDLIEYALLGGLIAAALIAVAVLTAMTTSVTDMAEGIGECIDFDAVDCGV